MKFYLLTLLSVLSAGFAFAQDGEALTLQKAIEQGLSNSKQLQLSRAKLEEATSAVKEAENRRLPDVSASANYLRVSNPSINLKTKTDNGTGGEPATTSPKVSQVAYGMVNVTMPLYSGLRIKHGIEASRFLEQAATLDVDHDKQGVIYNIIDAYNNLYKANLQVGVISSSLNQAQQRVKDFTNLEANGLLARNDLLKSQLQASTIELSLADAKNNAKLNSIVLNLLLGLPDSSHLSLDSNSFNTPALTGNVYEFMQQGLQNRKDYAAADLRIKAANEVVKSVQGEKYPTIGLTGGYVAADIPNFLTVYNAVNLGVGVSYSLSSLWKNEAKLQGAKAREKQAQIGRTQLEDAIELQIGRAYLNYTNAQEKINVYELATRQAEENYHIIKNKFDNSLATTTDLLEAEVAQLQAKLNYTTAKSDAAVAYKKLQQAMGTL